jgi:two-component system response regulator DesR
LIGDPVPAAVHRAQSMVQPSSNQTIRVVCVDDNVDLAGLLRVVINTQPDMKCVATLHDTDRLLDEIQASRPNVMVLDLSIPGRDVLDLTHQLAVGCPETRIIIYSGYDDPQTRDQAINAGAWGLVSKHHDTTRLVEAIRTVAGGHMVNPT